jgi:hypothetical protein
MIVAAPALFCLAVWDYPLLGRGGFWLGRERDDAAAALASPAVWPEIVAVIPARDEAQSIGMTVASLMRRDYPGRLSLVVVDDQSSDGAAEAARAAARLGVVAGRAPRLMAAAYRSIFDRMVSDGFTPPRRRVGASRLAILGALLRNGLP